MTFYFFCAIEQFLVDLQICKAFLDAYSVVVIECLYMVVE